MSKLATVQALSDSAPQPERLRATMELQAQIAQLTQQVQDLGPTLTQLAQASKELSTAQIAALTQQVQSLGKTLVQWEAASSAMSTAQRQQVLDLAALIEPIPERLAAIEQRQQAQDERLAKLEAALGQLTAALPAPIQMPDGRKMRPRLASSREVQAVPAQVWERKPSMFGKS